MVPSASSSLLKNQIFLDHRDKYQAQSLAKNRKLCGKSEEGKWWGRGTHGTHNSKTVP